MNWTEFSFAPENRALALLRSSKSTWGCSEGNNIYYGDSFRGVLELRALPTGRLLVRRDYSRRSRSGRAAVAVEYSSDGTRAVSWGPWPTLRVWDTASGAEATGHEGHDGGVRFVLLDSDGTRAYSSDEHDHVAAWGVGNENPGSVLLSSGMDIRSLVISPDGRYLAALEELEGWLEAVSIWELPSGKRLARGSQVSTPRAYARLPDTDGS